MDPTVILSVFAGLLVVVLLPWGIHLFQAVQRAWLIDEAGDALEAAVEAGLRLQPTGFRARIVATGQLDGRPVRVEWRTGLLGPRTVVRGPTQQRRHDLVRTAEELRALLAG